MGHTLSKNWRKVHCSYHLGGLLILHQHLFLQHDDVLFVQRIILHDTKCFSQMIEGLLEPALEQGLCGRQHRGRHLPQ